MNRTRLRDHFDVVPSTRRPRMLTTRCIRADRGERATDNNVTAPAARLLMD